MQVQPLIASFIPLENMQGAKETQEEDSRQSQLFTTGYIYIIQDQ